MQYLGGKSRLAPRIAAIVNAERRGRPFWDPFCGGLSVAVQLARGGPGVVSDAQPALIALYRAIRGGWAPPEHVSEAEYHGARSLPDTDPRKAHAGFGCSFGGKWFGGYARQPTTGLNFAATAGRSVRRGVASLGGCAIECLDFLAIEPQPLDLVIYCDPPYAGTETYAGAAPFDSARFWARARAWAQFAPVFASEYACPIPHEIVMETKHELGVAGGKQSGARTERLFRVLP